MNAGRDRGPGCPAMRLCYPGCHVSIEVADDENNDDRGEERTMSTDTAEPSWTAATPHRAVRAWIQAVEHVFAGRESAVHKVILDGRVEPLWFVIQSVDTIASAARSHRPAVYWGHWRSDLHQRAIEAGLDDEWLRLRLAIVALAEGRERSQELHVAELTEQAVGEFGALDLAGAAVELAAVALRLRYDVGLPAVFRRMREFFDIENA